MVVCLRRRREVGGLQSTVSGICKFDSTHENPHGQSALALAISRAAKVGLRAKHLLLGRVTKLRVRLVHTLRPTTRDTIVDSASLVLLLDAAYLLTAVNTVSSLKFLGLRIPIFGSFLDPLRVFGVLCR